MESIKLQVLLECFFYGPNECRTVDSHGSHGLLLCVCGVAGGWTRIMYEKWVTTRKVWEPLE